MNTLDSSLEISNSSSLIKKWIVHMEKSRLKVKFSLEELIRQFSTNPQKYKLFIEEDEFGEVWSWSVILIHTLTRDIQSSQKSPQAQVAKVLQYPKVGYRWYTEIVDSEWNIVNPADAQNMDFEDMNVLLSK